MPQIATQLSDALIRIKTVFEARSINYCVIGGVAVGYQSQPRFTKDVDSIVNIPQLTLPSVLEDLIAQGFELELFSAIKRWTQEHMIVFQYEGFRIDWLKPAIPLHQHVINTAQEVEWNGQKVRFATIESLILLKLIAFRGQDQVDIESLISVTRNKLDLPYIKTEWQTIGELTDPPMIWFKEKYQVIVNS